MLTRLVKYRVCYRNVCGACSQEVRQELRLESGHEARENSCEKELMGSSPGHSQILSRSCGENKRCRC